MWLRSVKIGDPENALTDAPHVGVGTEGGDFAGELHAGDVLG